MRRYTYVRSAQKMINYRIYFSPCSTYSLYVNRTYVLIPNIYTTKKLMSIFFKIFLNVLVNTRYSVLLLVSYYNRTNFSIYFFHIVPVLSHPTLIFYVTSLVYVHVRAFPSLYLSIQKLFFIFCNYLQLFYIKSLPLYCILFI